MTKKDSYYTALGKSRIMGDELLFYKYPDGSVIFTHDLFNGLPTEYEECEVVYTELPWKQGMKKFEDDAGINARDYKKFLLHLNKSIAELLKLDIVIILVGGKSLENSILTPTKKFDVTLNNGGAVAYIYGGFADVKFKTEIELLNYVTNKYNVIGDFCCGYGRTAKLSHEKGKKFIVSDLNSRCIGYIKENLKW